VVASLALVLSSLAPAALAMGLPIVHGAVQVIPPSQVIIGEQPVIAVAVPDREAVIYIECAIGDPDKPQQSFKATSDLLPAGTPAQLSLTVQPPVTTASCTLVANFANGLTERKAVDLDWTWVESAPEPEPQPGSDPQSDPASDQAASPAP